MTHSSACGKELDAAGIWPTQLADQVDSQTNCSPVRLSAILTGDTVVLVSPFPGKRGDVDVVAVAHLKSITSLNDSIVIVAAHGKTEEM